MNKKLNTVLFVLGATVANVAIMMVLFLVVFILYARFLAPVLSEGVNSMALLVIFVGSIVATYFIYNRLIKHLTDKIEMEKYFDPIFRTKKK
ncbi:MAG: hypothetical protein EA426_07400 [Spirochaetaceae bacterium]|nr:MAG: hypothetical protein EA426_07400 [Spirochaetaceae bacterium]